MNSIPIFDKYVDDRIHEVQADTTVYDILLAFLIFQSLTLVPFSIESTASTDLETYRKDLRKCPGSGRGLTSVGKARASYLARCMSQTDPSEVILDL